MPEKLLPATIRARVHEDAISRVTRFFDATTVETLNELFQNARRAGATRVDVTIAGGEVRVADDGRGIAHPAALLAFGQSRWDADTARREDPAGMGVYALARRPRVTIRSRPRPADGRQIPAWEVHLAPEHFLGDKLARVNPIDDESLAFGTEVVFDDGKANTGNLDCAAQHFPLPVTCNGKNVERRNFLHDAVHVEQWRGIRLGVRAVGYHPGRGPELNFHGILIEDVRLPVICSMASHWHVKADVVDCAELELVLPARKSVVETPFVDQLRTACRSAVYRAMLECDEQISVPADVRADALAHGVQLPVARPELAPWRPAYSNEYSTKQERPRRTALPDRPIVIEADIPPCDQIALWRAAKRSDVSHRLVAEEPRYRGYPWYDRLAKARKLTTRAVLDGEEQSIEEQRKTARAVRYGPAGTDHVRARGRRHRRAPLHPRRRGVRRRRRQLGGRCQHARHPRQQHHPRRPRRADVRRVLLALGRRRGRQLRHAEGELPAGGLRRVAGTARLGGRSDALERAHGGPPLDTAAPATETGRDHPHRREQARRDQRRGGRQRKRDDLSERVPSARAWIAPSNDGTWISTGRRLHARVDHPAGADQAGKALRLPPCAPHAWITPRRWAVTATQAPSGSTR